MKHEILPLRTALLWIFLFTALISGSTGIALWGYKLYERHLATDERRRVAVIFQHRDATLPLKSAFIAELLGLSADLPTYLGPLNIAWAESQLLQSPYIKAVKIKKMPPDALFVDYTMREPIALLADYSNVCLDDKGIAMPFKPLFEGESIPILVLCDAHEVLWGHCIQSENLKFGLELLKKLKSWKVFESIKLVDVSRIHSLSAGKRELIIILEDESKKGVKGATKTLRLGIDHFEDDLCHYETLSCYMTANKELFSSVHLIIDLRVPHLAFLSVVE